MKDWELEHLPVKSFEITFKVQSPETADYIAMALGDYREQAERRIEQARDAWDRKAVSIFPSSPVLREKIEEEAARLLYDLERAIAAAQRMAETMRAVSKEGRDDCGTDGRD